MFVSDSIRESSILRGTFIKAGFNLEKAVFELSSQYYLQTFTDINCPI